MTFLQLCQYVQRYIAGGNDLPGSGNPTTTVAQTGLYLEIVGWVQDAYRDIQQEDSGWLFRQAEGVLLLTSARSSYAKATVQVQLPTYERIYPYKNGDIEFISGTDTGSSLGLITTANCYYIPFEKWGGVVTRAQNAPSQNPAPLPPYFTVTPNESLAFFPIPTWTGADGPTTMTFQYTQTILNLVNDADVPVWPSEWHDAIAWRAIRYWAMVRESASKYQIADMEYKRSMAALRQEMLAEPPHILEQPPTKDTP